MGSGASSSYSSIIDPEISFNSTNFPFDVDSILGKGGHAIVYHGIDRETQKSVAIKQTNIENAISHGGIEFLLNEFHVFQRIGSHEFIVNLHLAFRTRQNCYLVMDCLRGGDLRQILKSYGPLNEAAVIYIVGCMGSALNYLHSRGIIHRDIKPENISLDLWGRPKLIDFGISVISGSDNPIPICRSSSGTMCYLAPEVLTPENIHSYQSDFWSLGAVAYELLYCRRLFEKHCPVYFVQFSANQYSHMWNQLKDLKVSSLSLDFHKLSKEFEETRPKEENGRVILPFPTLGLTLEADDSLPPSLIIFFPTSRPNSLEPLSDHCKSLLQGLLDVRIPYRLGSLTSFSQFSEHPIFHYYQYSFHQLQFLQSPLIAYAYQPLKKPPSETHHIDIESFSASISYPKEIEDKLAQYYYVSPKRFHSKKRPSTAEITSDTIFLKLTGR